MRYSFVIFAVVSSLLFGCKETTVKTERKVEAVKVSEEKPKSDFVAYPDAINKVFEAHGGMDRWKAMNNLCFEFEGRGGIETQTISLHDRRVKIESKKWTIGYDGSDIWLLQNEPDAYKSNARFYHNLMFYFYAMPFVLGDDGITYTEVEERMLDGASYKGIKISYHTGVGDSPDDEYIIFYNPITYQMEWLGYTVTYGDNAKSDKWSFIKYSEWTEVNNLVLPKTLTWYEVENGAPVKSRNAREFNKITVTETMLSDEVFAKPATAEIVKE